MNQTKPVQIYWDDLLEMRDEIGEATLEWESMAGLYCGSIASWGLSPQTVRFQLKWLCGKVETDWEFISENAYAVEFQRLEVASLTWENGNIWITIDSLALPGAPRFMIRLHEPWVAVLNIVLHSKWKSHA